MKHGRSLSRAISQGVFILVFLFFLDGFIGAHAVPSATAAPDKTLPKTISRQSLPLMVDVGADKCVPCKMMAPILEELKKEYAGVFEVRFVDAWKNEEEARPYRVRGIPTQIFYDASGKELGRHMGFISKEDILKQFRELGVELKKLK